MKDQTKEKLLISLMSLLAIGSFYVMYYIATHVC